MDTLIAMMEEEQRQAMWRDYIATSVHAMGSAIISFGGGQWPYPRWMELAYPSEAAQDKRTAQQIVDDLLKGLGGE